MAYTYSIVFEVSPNIHLILKFLDEKVLFLEIGKIEKFLHIVLVNVSHFCQCSLIIKFNFLAVHPFSNLDVKQEMHFLKRII